MFLHFAAVAEIVFHDASLLQKPVSLIRRITDPTQIFAGAQFHPR
jgi:hypothetical protein